MITKKMPQISLYGNSLLKTKKDRWNEIHHDEYDSQVGILNVVPCLANISETNLIFIHDE
jgi:hypothetical protein